MLGSGFLLVVGAAVVADAEVRELLLEEGLEVVRLYLWANTKALRNFCSTTPEPKVCLRSVSSSYEARG